jgi:hypothetical protein
VRAAEPSDVIVVGHGEREAGDECSAGNELELECGELQLKKEHCVSCKRRRLGRSASYDGGVATWLACGCRLR